MKISYISPNGKEIDISSKFDNYFLPIAAKIKISDCESIYINSKLQKISTPSYFIDYKGENITLIYGGDTYSVKSYGMEPSQLVKNEYIEFAKCLNCNYGLDRKIDNDSLFLSVENSDMPEVGIKLCTFDREVEGVKTDCSLEVIHQYRTHLEQVFIHPKIHLKDDRELLPIEVVTRINHDTIKHLASHSENWESRRATGLVPSRLLARTLEDNFAIYENIVAKNLVDKLYKYILKKRKELKDIGLGKESYTTLNNEAENVYKAQNILYNGYSEGGTKSISSITDSQGKMVKEILETLILCRESNLYNRLRKEKGTLSPLKVTNIFMMDKHYKYIYKLWNYINGFHVADIGEDENTGMDMEYSLYCQTMLHFALTNFNFINEEPIYDIFDEGNMCKTNYNFNYWSCSVSQVEIQSVSAKAIYMEFGNNIQYQFEIEEPKSIKNIDLSLCAYIDKKLILKQIPTEKQIEDICFSLYPNVEKRDRAAAELRRNLKQTLYGKFHNIKAYSIKIILIPLNFMFLDTEAEVRNCVDALKKEVDSYMKDHHINYCYFLTPFRPNDYQNAEYFSLSHAKLLLNYPSLYIYDEIRYGMIPISISDINSFRRLSKLCLMHMVEIDEEHKYCPICGNELRESNGVYSCHFCTPKFELRKTKCGSCGKYYLNSNYNRPNFIVNDKPSYALIMNEIRNGYKNITDTMVEGNGLTRNICPFCERF